MNIVATFAKFLEFLAKFGAGMASMGIGYQPLVPEELNETKDI